MVAALAAGDGIRTPRLLGVTEIDADRLALAFVRIEGSSLDGVPAERLTDDVPCARRCETRPGCRCPSSARCC
jgi:hypothetical protein